MKKNQSKTQKNAKYTCLKLLYTLNEKEINELQKFVISPYFNNDQTIVKLLTQLTKRALSNEPFSENMKLFIYEKVFLEKVKLQQLSKKQQDRLVRKLNILGKLIEQFLVMEALKNKPAYFNNFLSEELIAKKQYGILKRHLKQSQKKLDAQKIKDAEFHYHQFKLKNNRLENYYVQGTFDKKFDVDFEQVDSNLDMYYTIMKLDLNRTLLAISNNSIRKIEIASKFNISDFPKKGLYQSKVQIIVKKAAISFLMQQNKPAYLHLLQLIDKYKTEFSNRDLRHFFISAANFCIKKIKEDKFSLSELLSIYKKMDKLDLHIENRLINIIHLKNMIGVACKTGDFEWAIEILGKYKKYIYEKNRNNVFNLNYCAILYYQKLYKEALQYAIKVEPFDVLYDKTCRILMIKCHYELDNEYDERSERIFRSANKYFRSIKELTSKDRLSYRNFFQIFINLYRIKHGIGKMSLARLKQKLEHQEINSDKTWLLSKINALES